MGGFRGGGVTISQDGTVVGTGRNIDFRTGSGGVTPAASISGGIVGVSNSLGPATVAVNPNGIVSIPNATDTFFLPSPTGAFDSLPGGEQQFVNGDAALHCRVRGLYLVTVNLQWQPSAAGLRMAALYTAGTGVFGSHVMAGVNNSAGSPPVIPAYDIQSFSVLCQLTAGQKLTLWVRQTSGGALNMTGGQFAPAYGWTFLHP